ncbi:hypothetical protein A4X13_0g6112 [Tilletia indica]|uniref:Uncharacterized protein n=1 Tax=Tilletia indica TaxID=43049 RepID=A0A177TA11_9BASI|nr:hypothetical protein A4X13_0g6112 [Tilletia indica]
MTSTQPLIIFSSSPIHHPTTSSPIVGPHRQRPGHRRRLLISPSPASSLRKGGATGASALVPIALRTPSSPVLPSSPLDGYSNRARRPSPDLKVEPINPLAHLIPSTPPEYDAPRTPIRMGSVPVTPAGAPMDPSYGTPIATPILRSSSPGWARPLRIASPVSPLRPRSMVADEAEEGEPSSDDDTRSSDLTVTNGVNCDTQQEDSSSSRDSLHSSDRRFDRDDEESITEHDSEVGDLRRAVGVDDKEPDLSQETNSTTTANRLARREILNAYRDPKGTWRPPKGEEVDPPLTKVDKAGKKTKEHKKTTSKSNKIHKTIKPGKVDKMKKKSDSGGIPARKANGKGKERARSPPAAAKATERATKTQRRPKPFGNTVVRQHIERGDPGPSRMRAEEHVDKSSHADKPTPLKNVVVCKVRRLSLYRLPSNVDGRALANYDYLPRVHL